MQPRYLPSKKVNTTKIIEEMIRVDHAGEYGAKRIYQGQLSIIKDKNIASGIKNMLEQELSHLRYFEDKIKTHKLRPTMFLPIWHVGGFLLGAATAVMGKEALMACTVAVEEAIEGHYTDQIRTLEQIGGQEELVGKFKQFLAEELEHRDHGIEHGAENAFGYEILYQLIQTISKLAIFISKRI